jgi:glycine hydroxymethyltransferase
MKRINDFITNLKVIITNFKNNNNKNIPLCAAENIMSDFARIPLKSELQEKYIMGGTINYQEEDNFIGSELLFPIYEEINESCKALFNSNYSDPRTLSGMNTVTTLLMSIASNGDKILLHMPDAGAHASMPYVCSRLGLEIIEMPYDYENYNFDFQKINEIIKEENIKVVLFSPSDILFPPDFKSLIVKENTYIIYDATQTLGLIAGKALPNPLEEYENIILIGGTHKTIPGPTKGLILTKNMEIAKLIDSQINPTYLRNTQMHQVLSLLLTLKELEYFGYNYANKIINNSQFLGEELNKLGFNVIKKNNIYSKTHQIFLEMDSEKLREFYNKCVYYNITVNEKFKKLFNYAGIRIGVQEISRYNWDENKFKNIALLLSKIRDNCNEIEIYELINKINTDKILHFTFSQDITMQVDSIVNL